MVYDSTVASYNNQINKNRQNIAFYNQRIKKLEDDIEELKQLKVKTQGVAKTVAEAATQSIAKIGKMQLAILNPFAILRDGFFSDVKDIIQGSQYKQARNSLENAIYKINKKIKELEREIQSLRNNIRQCNSNIDSISRRKNKYISEQSEKENNK